MPEHCSDLARGARLLAMLLAMLLTKVTDCLRAAGAAVGVPGALRAMIWCCTAPWTPAEGFDPFGAL